ncbi:MAG: PD-(D/E)XK nuclease family protein, partial [Dehalococcoidia bacterium]|nr:PD-(D/E)XK nuclease family protein [Dehalococcoidia bacterium]
QAMAEAIPDRWAEIVELASRALSSLVVKRAVNSGRYYREVFVSTPLNGTLLEGFIDLVFAEDSGLVIADYKTDSLEEEVELEQARERYAIQVGAYGLAVQLATSMPVREVVLVFLRPAKEVSFTNIAELTDEARKLAEAKTEGSITG